MFEVCTKRPCSGCDGYDYARHDCGIGFPVCWLAVPASGRRPDVLWVTRHTISEIDQHYISVTTYGTFDMVNPVN